MPSVCFVTNELSRKSVFIELAKGLLSHTNIEDVAILGWFNKEDGLEIPGVDTYCVNAPRNRIGMSPSTLLRAHRIISQYDIIHTYNDYGAIAKVIGKLNGCRVVTREGNDHSEISWKYQLSNGLTNPLCDRIICVSESVRKSFSRWELALLVDKQITVIENGVDIEAVTSVESRGFTDETEFTVGTVGMLTEQKAQDELIRAVAKVNDKSDEPVHLYIVGDGPLKDSLQLVATREGMSDRVHFLGFLQREEVYSVLNELDVYAMPSHWEGLSLAALEALASGTACIFSDIDSFQIFKDVALFHEPMDIDELAESILTLQRDDQLRNDLRQRGQSLIRRHYSDKTVAQKHEAVYNNIT